LTTPLNLGFARIGAKRELKKAIEAYWSLKASAEELLSTARDIRKLHWSWQSDAGIPEVPSGDFSFYDHVLDTAWMFDAIPSRFRELNLSGDLALYFAMARGVAGQTATQALEMTKWFDTNYHYLVPEFTGTDHFRLRRNPQLDAYREAKALGLAARPVILGPVSFLLLGKSRQAHASTAALLDRLLPVYEELLRSLAAEGATSVQIDEPVLATDLGGAARALLTYAFTRIAKAAPLKILLATYFGPLRDNLDHALHLPVHAVHLDLVRGLEQFDEALRLAPKSLTLSLGLVDGRNIWKADLTRALELAERAVERLSADRVMVGPSCSLLHVPIDLSNESALPPDIKDWLSFGRQKLAEVVTITRALNEGREAMRAELDANSESLEKRRRSELVHNAGVGRRLRAIRSADFVRTKPFAERKPLQQAALGLPLLPTTTIGSFPQTEELRRQRARRRKNEITEEQYEGFIRQEITHAIR
jgi:5-methyltetrahydropteroyltriglutamate--homocysteine methyltransferase